jgi:hypothetical protein
MELALASAAAWFFVHSSHQLSGALVVRLVEGVKGEQRELVQVGEASLGPYFSIRVQPTSRVAEVRFAKALAFCVYDESYDARDPQLVAGPRGFLFVADASSFRSFAESATGITTIHEKPFLEYVLCCEDRIYHVLCEEPPSVAQVEEAPDLSLERTDTWHAS